MGQSIIFLMKTFIVCARWTAASKEHHNGCFHQEIEEKNKFKNIFRGANESKLVIFSP